MSDECLCPNGGNVHSDPCDCSTGMKGPHYTVELSCPIHGLSAKHDLEEIEQ